MFDHTAWKKSLTPIRRIQYWYKWSVIERLDDLADKYNWPDWAWAGNYELLEYGPQKLLCKIGGHEPEMDQCNRPEHDYCVWCYSLTPWQSPRSLKIKAERDNPSD